MCFSTCSALGLAETSIRVKQLLLSSQGDEMMDMKVTGHLLSLHSFSQDIYLLSTHWVPSSVLVAGDTAGPRQTQAVLKGT